MAAPTRKVVPAKSNNATTQTQPRQGTTNVSGSNTGRSSQSAESIQGHLKPVVRKQTEAEKERARSRVLADYTTSPSKGWMYTVSQDDGKTTNMSKKEYDTAANERRAPKILSAWWAGDEETSRSKQLSPRNTYTIRYGEKTYTLSQKEVDDIAEAHRLGWQDSYAGDDDDNARRQRGEMPRSYAQKYTTELDAQLMSLGLPSSRYLESYVSALRDAQAEEQALKDQYDAQVHRVDEFYKAVSQKWGEMEMQGFVDPDEAYTFADGTTGTVKDAQERAYFELLQQSEWEDVLMLSSASPEPIDPEKYADDYVGYQEALINQQQKQLAAAEKAKNAYTVSFSFDDFASRYPAYRTQYMNQRIVDKASGRIATRGQELDRMLTEKYQAEWQATYGKITSRKAARQWVEDHAGDDLVQVLQDMAENGVPADQLRQAKNAAVSIAKDRDDKELAQQIKDAYTELATPGALDLDAVVEAYEAGEASTMTVDQAAVRFMGGLEYDSSGKVTSDSIAAAINALADEGATAGVIKQGVDKTLTGLSRAGSYTGASSDVEDAILAATSDEISAYDAVQSSLSAVDRRRRTEIADVAREQMTAEGYTPFQIDQALSAKGWQDTISDEARAAHYFAERGILERIKDTDDANKYAAMTDEARLAFGRAQWDSLTAAEREEYTKEFIASADYNPELNRSYGQQLEQQFVGVFMRNAVGLLNSGVNLAETIATAFDGHTDRWAASEMLSELNQNASLYGKVNSPDIGSKLISIGSDVATEIIRMQTLGAAGGALVGFLRSATGINVVANAVGTSSAAAKGLRIIEKSVASSPFITSAIGSYFDEAKLNGATNKEAVNHALVCGSFEGALEAIGFDNWVARGLGGRKIAQKLLKGGTQAMRKGLQTQAKVIALVSSAIGNGIEEPLSYAASTFMQQKFNPNAEFSWKEAADNGLIGMLIGVAGSSLSMSSVNNSRIAAEYAASHGVSPTMMDIILAANQAEMMTEEQRRQHSVNPALLSKKDYDEKIFSIMQADENIRNAQERYNAFIAETDADIDAKQKKAASLMQRAVSYKGTQKGKKTTIFAQVQEAQTNLREAIEKRDAREPEMRKNLEISLEQNKRAIEKARDALASHFVGMNNLFQEDINAMRDVMGAENFDRNARAAQLDAWGDLDLQYTSATPDWSAVDADIQAIADADTAFTRRDEINAKAQAVLSLTEEKMRALRGGYIGGYISEQVEAAKRQAAGIDSQQGDTLSQKYPELQTQQQGTPPNVIAQADAQAQTQAPAQEAMQPDAARETPELPPRTPISEDDALRATQFGQKLGLAVVVEELPSWQDGFIEDGVLHINRNQRSLDGDGYSAMVYRVVTHELTHSLQGSAAYNAFASFVVKQLERETGVKARDLYEIECRAYADLSDGEVQLTLSQARQEIVATWAAEHLLKDEASIEKLVREQSGVAGRVMNWVQYQIAKLGLRKTPDSAEARILLEAERLYAKAFAKSGTKPSEAMRQYMLARDIGIGRLRDSGVDVSTFRSADGGSRARISDANSSIKLDIEAVAANPNEQTFSLEEVLDHPDLYSVYPEAKKVKVVFETRPNFRDRSDKTLRDNRGEYYPGKGIIRIYLPSIYDASAGEFGDVEGEYGNLRKLLLDGVLVDESDYGVDDEFHDYPELDMLPDDAPDPLDGFRNKIRGVLLHEVQHWVQDFDGAELVNATPELARAQILLEAFNEAEQDPEYKKLSGTKRVEKAIKIYQERMRETDDAGRDPAYGAYANSYNEIEAFYVADALDQPGYYDSDEYAEKYLSSGVPGIDIEALSKALQEKIKNAGQISVYNLMNPGYNSRQRNQAKEVLRDVIFGFGGHFNPQAVGGATKGDQVVRSPGGGREPSEARIVGSQQSAAPAAEARGGVEAARNSDEVRQNTGGSPTERQGLTGDTESTQQGAFSSRQYSVATPSWDELIARYGAHPQGMEPRGSDVRTPRRIRGSEATSRLVRSILESPQINDDMRAAIQDAVAEGELGTYTPQSNERLLERAQDEIAKGFPNAVQKFREEVNTGKVNAETVAMGEQLLVNAAADGDTATVIDLCASLSIAATEAGRATQAFSMLKKLGGVGQAYYVSRAVELMNRNDCRDAIAAGRMSEIQIDEALLDDLARAKTDEDVSRAMDAICQDIGSQIPPSLSEQLTSWRYLAMLGNPVTHIRNMTGNASMSALRSAKDAVAAGIERAFVSDVSQRAHAVYNSAKQADRIALADEMFVKYRQDIANGGRLGFEQLIQQYRRQFNSGALDALAKFNSGLLESEDLMFMRGAFKSAFTQYLVAQDIDPATITPEQEGAAARWAIDEAQRATFRDASSLARAISNFSKMNAATHVFVEGVMPFKKTPINVLKRGVDYSPIGVIEGAYMAAVGVKNGRYTVAQAVDRIASGLTGTALMALGAMLSRLGILRSTGEEEDAYETFLQGTGAQMYSLNIGDLSIGLSNIAPASIPLFMGVTLAEGLTVGDGSLMDMFTALASAANPLMEMSFMSSLNEVLSSYSNEGLGGAVGRVITSSVENYASQYLPTVGGKIADFVDPVKRTSAGSATSWLKGYDSYFRGLVRKVPGLSSAVLEPSINVKGERTVTNSFGEWLLDFANAFVLPVNVKVKNRDATDREIMRVFEATGNTDIIPTMPRKYFMVDGTRINLSASQYTQYAQERGNAVYAAINQTIKSTQYQNGDAEKKAALLKKAVESAEQTVLAAWKEKLAE